MITHETIQKSLIQALISDDRVMRRTFCGPVLDMVEDNETLFSCLVFSDEATFHLSAGCPLSFLSVFRH